MMKAAVIGVGHLGRFHAEKYSRIETVELVGVADLDRSRAEETGARLGVPAFFDHRELLGRVDAVSVAVPTRDHFTVARDFLEAGVHVLVEKPITRTLEEAEELIALAGRKGLVLQVGHLERFNPALAAAAAKAGPPLFIEANRIGPFPDRNTDVDVVLDLMIHDIDITLSLVGREPRWVHAVGVPVITSRVDIANARLEFDTGCVANLTASRISIKSERKLRIFQPDAYLSIDFGQRQVLMARRTAPEADGRPGIEAEELVVGREDALECEVRAFLTAAAEGTPPQVSGEDGRRALKVALKIVEDIRARQGAWLETQNRRGAW
ncbi:MAG: Gfo/Idh/MocA family oxidoreductase [Thermodesulfobacteriota bacterium]